jgi:hypothetical protein
MSNSMLGHYGYLRLLIGYLGEKAQENWWATVAVYFNFADV